MTRAPTLWSLPTRIPAASWRRIPVVGRDALLACVAAALTLVVSALEGWSRGHPPEITDAGAVAAWAVPIFAACAPLAVRRRLPLTAVAASAAVVLAVGLVLERDAGIWVLGLATASAAYHRHGLRLALLAGSIAWAAVLAVQSEAGPGLTAISVYAVAGAAPVAVGYALRLRADRAVQALRLQSAREERARAQEAARIARDVHDIVGHHLSAIRLQAVGARRALGGRDPEADRALGGIAGLSAEALAEIRAMLATLVRSETENEAHRPGIADLATLAERSGGSEFVVALDVGPHLDGTLSAETELCVYRVVQEALTNAARHSAAGSASVKVRAGGRRIIVTVDDPGPPHGSPGHDTGDGRVPHGGRGLAGMHERVTALGGRCHAGPNGKGGWRVRADLPPRPPDPSEERGPVEKSRGGEAGPQMAPPMDDRPASSRAAR
ncbi:histidine kinase [Nonomuraea aurantiaca]|uniref:histidine kinase n=1 Tax=Nonomuraea aurantiaca TaxID=2878562 RepID=UPI001CDA2BA6|nr:histidine kinase [Nonomuraea aurantiaca]MCA2220107.1 histidine kinase [Nonomuraea aurantiaca]